MPLITPTKPIKIVIFDSGVGGLSILQTIRNRLPYCELVFASDNAGYPYGPKAADEIIARLNLVLTKLVDNTHPDIVVVACNTASTVALPSIRQSIKIPIVGVVPAIKPAALISRSKVIGLLATTGTVKRAYTHQLIAEFAAGCTVIPVGSSELVDIAENKLRGTPVPMDKLSSILRPLTQALQQQPPMDTLVLACTHFPLLYDELKQCLGQTIHWIDSGDAIARRVAQLIDEHQLCSNPALACPASAIFTQSCKEIDQLNSALPQYGINAISFLDLN